MSAKDPLFGDVLDRVRPLVGAFEAAGFSLHLVGGAVRDVILQGGPDTLTDYDFTTNARPEEIERLLTPLCTTTWDAGRAFGTIGGQLRASSLGVEITTFRTEEYVDHSRKPAVTFGHSLDEDLSRRDFTINAMAVDVVALSHGTPWTECLRDPFGGLAHLQAKRLVAPSEPVGLFRDDPLRMMRAARFASRFGLIIDDALEAAAVLVKDELAKVSHERIRGELNLLLLTAQPSVGLAFLVRTGVADQFLPEISGLQLEQDPIHHHKDVLTHTYAVVDKTSPRVRLRMAALLHDIGKPATRQISPSDGVTFRFHDVVGAKMTRKRLKALGYSDSFVKETAELVALHLRFHTFKMGWSDAAVRRYVRDAGELLEDLNELTRCDCTTRNRRKADEIARHMDELEDRIVQLREQENLDNMRPAIDGVRIMEILNIPPSPAVKTAINFLMEIRLSEGEIAPAEAEERLLAWWPSRDAGANPDVADED